MFPVTMPFSARYPVSTVAGLKPVADEHEGFDYDDVKKLLGAKFSTFEKSVKYVFVCTHRYWPEDHPELHKRNTEVHCFHAEDVEAFLRGN